MTNSILLGTIFLATIIQINFALPSEQKHSNLLLTQNAIFRRTLPRNDSSSNKLPSSSSTVHLPATKSAPAPGKDILSNTFKFLTHKPFNGFDWKLGKILDNTEKNNLIVSTISVKLILGMLYLGVHDVIAKEIENAFSIDSSSKDVIIQEFSKILHSLKRSTNNEYELNIGTQLYFDKLANVTRTFEEDLQKYFNTSVKQLDFKQPDIAVQTINDWCSLITKEKIRNLITKDDISEATAMMLVNAIYFKGEWEHQFPSENTVPDTFWQYGKTPISVPIMSMKDNLYYYNMTELEAHLLRMPYTGKKFAMYILVPYEVDGLKNLSKKLGPEYLSESLSNMTEKLIHLRLPKFHFESSAVLVPVLKKLGINELFNPTANLMSIGSSTNGPLMISSILQKSGIEVNEKGSTAYAATEVQIVSRFGQDTLDINVTHPFYFLIADEEQDTIIFIGKVVNPDSLAMNDVVAKPLNEVNTRVKPSNGNVVEAVEDIQNDKYNYFDKELLQKLAQLKPDSNIVLSPASIKSSLAVLLEGAGGNTETQIKHALRLPNDKEKLSAILQEQLKALKYKNQASIANLTYQNKIYLAQGEKLLPEYQNTVKNTYQSDIEMLNFANLDAAVKQINKWVNNTTEGLIPTLVNKDSFDAMTKLLLINCIYFKADWDDEFNAQLTRKDCFYDSKGQCQYIDFMYGKKEVKYQYSKILDANIIEIPFKDPRYSMIFMLPNRDNGVYNLLKDLGHQDLNSLISNMGKHPVQLTLPKTIIEFSSGLSSALRLVDITDLFTPIANLSRILENGKHLAVRDIVHKAKIEINEKGAKAAAATETQAVLLNAPYELEFKANHPFLFFIRDMNTAGFLFEGLLVKPDPINGSKVSSILTKKEAIPNNSTIYRKQSTLIHTYNTPEKTSYSKKLLYPPPPGFAFPQYNAPLPKIIPVGVHP